MALKRRTKTKTKHKDKDEDKDEDAGDAREEAGALPDVERRNGRHSGGLRHRHRDGRGGGGIAPAVATCRGGVRRGSVP